MQQVRLHGGAADCARQGGTLPAPTQVGSAQPLSWVSPFQSWPGLAGWSLPCAGRALGPSRQATARLPRTAAPTRALLPCCAVAALLAFKGAVTLTVAAQGSASLPWPEGVDPCGSASCSSALAPRDPGLPACNWAGIACRGWRVTQLQLSCSSGGLCLSGTLAPQLAGASALESVLLRGHSLQGPLPANWSTLGSLRELELAGNALSGGRGGAGPTFCARSG